MPVAYGREDNPNCVNRRLLLIPSDVSVVIQEDTLGKEHEEGFRNMHRRTLGQKGRLEI